MMPEDHDTLIRLTEKVDNLIAKVSTLTDDHERRIRFLERWVWGAIGGLLIIDTIIGYYLTIRK